MDCLSWNIPLLWMILGYEYPICGNPHFWGERNCRSLNFFIQEPISEELHCGLGRTHTAICMCLKQDKQMSSNVSGLRQFNSIYVNLLQHWIWIYWIRINQRIWLPERSLTHHKSSKRLRHSTIVLLRPETEVSRKTIFLTCGIVWVSIEVSTAQCKHFTLHLLFSCLQPWNGAGIGGSWSGIESNAPVEWFVLAS